MHYLIAVLSTIFLLQPADVSADTDLTGCRSLKDDAKRLLCYDRLVDARIQLDAPANEEKDIELKQPQQAIATTQPDKFGQRTPARREVEQINASITELDKSPFGKLFIKLDNAQTWVQLDSSRVFLKAGDDITIRTSSLQSFQLRKASGGKSIRVKRVD